MSSKLLTRKGQEISRTSVIPLSIEERNSPAIPQKINEFEVTMKVSLGDRISGIPIEPNDEIPQYETYGDDSKGDEPTMIEADDLDYDEYHRFISARVLLPRSGEKAVGRVIKRKKNDDGQYIGKAHKNPLLDTSQYDVEFMDGVVETYSANQVAEGIFAQVDDEGKEYDLIDEIIDHKKSPNAVTHDDAFYPV